jgi:hypothetical protein
VRSLPFVWRGFHGFVAIRPDLAAVEKVVTPCECVFL